MKTVYLIIMSGMLQAITLGSAYARPMGEQDRGPKSCGGRSNVVRKYGTLNKSPGRVSGSPQKDATSKAAH